MNFLGGLKSVTGQQVFDHLENFFNLKAFDTLQNTLNPLVLQSASAGGGQSLIPLRCDATNLENSHAEFQLPLKGFYRHFKEMTETSKRNSLYLLVSFGHNIMSFCVKLPLSNDKYTIFVSNFRWSNS